MYFTSRNLSGTRRLLACSGDSEVARLELREDRARSFICSPDLAHLAVEGDNCPFGGADNERADGELLDRGRKQLLLDNQPRLGLHRVVDVRAAVMKGAV